jgi:predicted dehydrogenase
LRRIPAAELRVIATGSPEQAAALQKTCGFARASSSTAGVIADPDVDAVVIANRHSSHAGLVVEALRAGKHVFVEKPLALSLDELHAVAGALTGTAGSLMVGFNRRFAPDYAHLRDWFRSSDGQASILYRINAGWMPAANWIMDVSEGGRFLGELCHYIDLAMDLAASPLARVYASSPDGAAGGDFSVTLEFEAPIVATLAYTSSGHRRVARERLEVFRGEAVATIDNYTRCQIDSAQGSKVWRHFGSDRGHRQELTAWVDSLQRTGQPPATARSFLASAEANLLALQSALTGQPIASFEYR